MRRVELMERVGFVGSQTILLRRAAKSQSGHVVRSLSSSHSVGGNEFQIRLHTDMI